MSTRAEVVTEEVQAHMCVWWVFAIDKIYSDRPEGVSWQETVQAGPATTDRLTVTIGDIPKHIVRGIREVRATHPYVLSVIFGQNDGRPTEERDQLLDELCDTQEVEDIYQRDQYGLWASFEMCRPVEVEASSSKYFWARAGVLDQAREFANQATPYLSAAVARIQAGMEPLHLAKTLVQTGAAYIVARGKAALRDFNFQGRAVGRVSSTGWKEVTFDQVSAALQDLPVGGQQMQKLLRSAGRWLWAALAEDEDRLRQFLFSFLGLEILASKAEVRLRESVTSSLSQELEGLPIGDLMWPSVRDDDYPYRNLVFRFALLAVALSRETAVDDVSTFKRLAKTRNDLAHGAADEIDELPANECVSLLHRYVSLAAAADASGHLGS